MRIALLTDGIFPFVLGGMQKHSTELARHLALQGVEVDLYHCVPEGQVVDLSKVFESAALKHIRDFQFQFPAPGKIPGHYIRNSYKYAKRLYDKLSETALPDFIYAQGFAGWYTLEQKRKNEMLPPIGVNFHGLNMFQQAYGTRAKLEQKLFKKPVKANLELADVVFSLGGKLTGIQQQLVSNPNKVITIPNGIDEHWVQDKASFELPMRFLFIGRFDKVKGLADLYEALQGIDAEASFSVNFVGPIPTEHQMDDPRCVYHGKILDEQALRSLVGKNHILLCPSLSEGMPTVILEAMASQLTVLATDVGATSELVDQEGGWLIEPGNSQEIKRAIQAAMRTETEQLKAFGQHNQAKIKKDFLWKSVATKTLTTIKNYQA